MFLCFQLFLFAHSFIHSYRTLKKHCYTIYLQIYCSQQFACSCTVLNASIRFIAIFPLVRKHPLLDLHSLSSSSFDISTIWTIAQTCTLKHIHLQQFVKIYGDRCGNKFFDFYSHSFLLLFFFSLPCALVSRLDFVVVIAVSLYFRAEGFCFIQLMCCSLQRNTETMDEWIGCVMCMCVKTCERVKFKLST